MALNYVPNEVSILGSVVETNWEGLCDNLQRKNPQFDLFWLLHLNSNFETWNIKFSWIKIMNQICNPIRQSKVCGVGSVHYRAAHLSFQAIEKLCKWNEMKWKKESVV